MQLDKKRKYFSLTEMQILYNNAEKRKSTSEICMLVYLLLRTRLKISDLLGWFNHHLNERVSYLGKYPELLEDYIKVPRLFPKKHQTYLLQFKKICRKWIRVENASFQMLQRSKISSKGILTF